MSASQGRSTNLVVGMPMPLAICEQSEQELSSRRVNLVNEKFRVSEFGVNPLTSEA